MYCFVACGLLRSSCFGFFFALVVLLLFSLLVVVFCSLFQFLLFSVHIILHINLIIMMRLCIQRLSTRVTATPGLFPRMSPVFIPQRTLSTAPTAGLTISPLNLSAPKSFMELLLDGILYIKRTFQPSLLRRKRKHGFLVRARTNNGNKTLTHRRTKKRRYICA